MLRSAFLLGAIAMLLSALDLAHKAGARVEYFHARSLGYVLVVLLLSTAWAAAILATRSLPMAIGGGAVLGGAAGNVVSIAFWPGVPNPIEVGAIAFNLADVFVLVGFLAVALAAIALLCGDRERLRRRVRYSAPPEVPPRQVSQSIVLDARRSSA
jgi:Signal peptidase (SPase) II